MSVYCPDCGNLLQNGASPKKGGAQCRRCLRPLGDRDYVERPSVVEKGFRALFVNSIPLAIASVLAGLILIVLALCVLFPVEIQHWLGRFGLTTEGEALVLGVPVRLMEALMITAGVCALIVLVRLPAGERAQGRV